MRSMKNRVVVALTAVAALAAGPAWAQSPLAVIPLDGTQYVFPADAAKNVDAVRVLIAAAAVQGLIRNPIRTVGGSINSMVYRGAGTMGGQNVNVAVNYEYRLPAIRVDVTRPDKSREVTVASGDLSWDESKPGVFLRAAATPAADRLLPLWLLPPFIIYEGSRNAGQIKLATVGGMRELTIPVSRYKTDVKAIVNPKGEIVHAEMTVGGKLYSADFSNYQGDSMEYHVYFPHKIVQKVDGVTVADLTLSDHIPSPYAVWPIPQELKANAAR